MPPRFTLTHTLTPEQHRLYYHLLYSKVLKSERTFSLIATALLLALTPYLFADNSKAALLFASVLFLNFVNSVFLTQQLAFFHRLITRKRYEKFPVQYLLYEDTIRIVFSASNHAPISVPYEKILFCIESDDALLLPIRVESAVLVLPKDALTSDSLNGLHAFLTEKTGNDLRPSVS